MMPPKSKRQRQSAEAASLGRETLKKPKTAENVEIPGTTEAGNTETESGTLGGERDYGNVCG